MILADLTDDYVVILEASDEDSYGGKLYFNYIKTVKGIDVPSSPTAFYLGTWNRKLKNGRRKKYLCGINLNYLDATDIADLQHNLPDILKSKQLPGATGRYWTARRLVPDIMEKAYREYKYENISRVVKGRIFALKVTDEDKKIAQRYALEDGKEFKELDYDEKNQYLEKAIRNRGEKSIERQEKAHKERESISIEPKEPPVPISQINLEPEKETLPPSTAERPPAPKTLPPLTPKTIGIPPISGKHKAPTQARRMRPVTPGPGIPYRQLSAAAQAVSGVAQPKRLRMAEPAPAQPAANVVDQESEERE